MSSPGMSPEFDARCDLGLREPRPFRIRFSENERHPLSRRHYSVRHREIRQTAVDAPPLTRNASRDVASARAPYALAPLDAGTSRHRRPLRLADRSDPGSSATPRPGPTNSRSASQAIRITSMRSFIAPSRYSVNRGGVGRSRTTDDSYAVHERRVSTGQAARGGRCG